jgi:peptidoglycan/xylan/chitin deacetylase (PgdA/CDA1 family)
VRIVNFHGLGTPQRPLEAGEARYWISAQRFRDIVDLIASHHERQQLSITFDDGNLSDISIAAPELSRHGLDAQFFVLAQRIGRPGSLGRQDMRELLSMGMRIGSHGLAHSDWTSLSPRQLSDELTTSKAIIEDVLGVPVLAAAVPFGRYNASVLRALRAAGYRSAYSSDGGWASARKFLKPRTSIVLDHSDGNIDRILAGKTPVLGLMRRWVATTAKTWL